MLLCLVQTNAVTIEVQVDKPGASINPAMWGIFFEDINLGTDGGLYAELIKNRAFEFPDPIMGWTKLCPTKSKGQWSIRDDNPFNAANPHYLRIQSESPAPFGVANEGFRRIGVKKGEAYNFSAQIRKVDGMAVLRVALYGSDGAVLDSMSLKDFSNDWKKVELFLNSLSKESTVLNGPQCLGVFIGGDRFVGRLRVL